MDIQSLLGYAHFSPFRNSPYLDIKTPDGSITMENTNIDLMGIDNLGNVKRMKAGRKNPYKFAGDVVREIPIKNNPYQKGGMTKKQLFDFLFDDEEPKATPAPPVTKAAEADEEPTQDMPDFSQDDLAMNIALADFYKSNPYSVGIGYSVGMYPAGMQMPQSGNPFTRRNQNLYEASKSLEGQRYVFGGDGSTGNGVDCSGAVCKIVGLPRMTSEQIVSKANNFRVFSGDPYELTEGTVIGFDTGPTSFDKGRTYGIDHTGVIVRNPNTGQLEYKHSAGSTGFKTLTIPEMLSKYRKAKNIYLGNY